MCALRTVDGRKHAHGPFAFDVHRLVNAERSVASSGSAPPVLARVVGGWLDAAMSGDDDREGPGIFYFVTVMVLDVVFGMLASIIAMWFSRYREFRADAGGARLAGREKMIAALRRLSQTYGHSTLPGQIQAFGISGAVGQGLRSLFLPERQSWYSVASERELQQRRAHKPDAARFRASDYDTFARSIEQSKAAEEERFSNIRIHTDGAVASVHFDFVYLSDGKPANQGQEAWHLIRTDAGWKIVSLIYSVDRPAT